MLTYNELRIGNLVEYNGKIYPVYGIMAIPSYNHVLILGDQKEEVEPDIAWVTPVPVTKEKLLEYGFEKTGYSRWTFSGIVKIACDFIYANNKVILSRGEYSSEIFIDNVDYMHQLQNTFFALTNQELQINQPVTT